MAVRLVEAGDKLANFNCKRVFVIYGKGIEASGIPIPIIKAIEAFGIAAITCNEVESDPRDVIIKEMAEIGRREKVDGIAAVGGGSCMDAAKCVKLLFRQ